MKAESCSYIFNIQPYAGNGKENGNNFFLALPINILGNISLRRGGEDTQDNVLTLL